MIYCLVKLIRKALLKLPLGVSLFLARLIGLVFYLNGRKRRVAFKNIKIAFPEKTNHQVHSILRRSFGHFGLTIIEQLIVSRIYKNVTLKEEKNEYPEGGIFVGIHAGNWALSTAYWAQRYKFAIFAQQQKHKELNNWTLNSKGSTNSLPIYSTRKGEITGTHKVIYESGEDKLTLVHEAKNREGFALGAVLAVEFIVGKHGIFNMEDLLKQML